MMNSPFEYMFFSSEWQSCLWTRVDSVASASEGGILQSAAFYHVMHALRGVVNTCPLDAAPQVHRLPPP